MRERQKISLENVISDPRISVKKSKILLRVLKGKYNRESRSHACIQLFIIQWAEILLTPNDEGMEVTAETFQFSIMS